MARRIVFWISLSGAALALALVMAGLAQSLAITLGAYNPITDDRMPITIDDFHRRHRVLIVILALLTVIFGAGAVLSRPRKA